ncbi:hypothetical protein QQ045_011678 [Rhodiola kirilowii]
MDEEEPNPSEAELYSATIGCNQGTCRQIQIRGCEKLQSLGKLLWMMSNMAMWRLETERGRRRGLCRVLRKETLVAETRYHLGKRVMSNGRRMEARGGEFTENGNVVDQQNSEMQAEEVRNKGDEQVTKTNCPCHSRSENQHSGGYWVRKFIELESGAEVEGVFE